MIPLLRKPSLCARSLRWNHPRRGMVLSTEAMQPGAGRGCRLGSDSAVAGPVVVKFGSATASRGACAQNAANVAGVRFFAARTPLRMTSNGIVW